MKKTIVLGLAVVMALTTAVTTFSSGLTSEEAFCNHDGVQVESTSQGNGACRHALCGCTKFTRATNGAGKCTCGHWDYVHD